MKKIIKLPSLQRAILWSRFLNCIEVTPAGLRRFHPHHLRNEFWREFNDPKIDDGFKELVQEGFFDIAPGTEGENFQFTVHGFQEVERYYKGWHSFFRWRRYKAANNLRTFALNTFFTAIVAILIGGGAGFLGSYLEKKLLSSAQIKTVSLCQDVVK